ncbi:unnamed protein product [Phaedon cochleariae]|uniref:Gamma-interferon-inducible lysosomal thiol reductase n=1 Tax=Phaedon cochleariae TaxID=80249 RepID=A0A9P0DW64_PHACE|nr:unnamed protein product [Phaedon cochleariae]
MRRIVAFILIILFVPDGNYAKNISVSVFYESLCPDSVDFLSNQFYPAYISIKEKIQVELVPFGKATANWANGTWIFSCQHGPKECYGNMVHSCAIDLSPGDNSTEFVVCAMKSGDASLDGNLQQCAIDHGVNWTEIQNCVKSGKGNELLAKNGNRTGEVKEKVTFIPMVVFEHTYKEALQTIALRNFLEISEFLISESECERCKRRGKSGGSPKHFSSILVLLISVLPIKVLL